MEELLTKGRTEQNLFTIDGQAYTGAMFTRFASSHPQAVKRQLEGLLLNHYWIMNNYMVKKYLSIM